MIQRNLPDREISTHVCDVLNHTCIKGIFICIYAYTIDILTLP